MDEPWTPDMLAERWKCSGETIRQMVRCGQLAGFRVGNRIRIKDAVVMEYENCHSTKSDASVEDTASSGTNQTEGGGDIVFMRKRQPKPRLKLDRSFTRLKQADS